MKDILFDEPSWSRYNEDLGLERNAIHIFKIETDSFYEQIKLLYNNVLSEAELIKANRYAQIKDKKRHIVSRYALRNILSDFTGTEASSIQFHYTADKKPYLKEIEFNVTHSNNAILIAVSDQLVGIDMEYINKNFDYKILIPTVFNQPEQQFIDSGLNKLICFYLLWTRKEALLKATGEGLTDTMNQVNSLQPVVTRGDLGFYVKSLLINGSYMMSLATENNNDQIYYWNYE